MKLEVLYEDNHLLIVNKPAGIPTQSDITEDITMLDIAKEYIKDKYKKPGEVYIGLPHRLDRPTSGVLVLAKTSKALERLTKMFSEHIIKKYYLAIVDKVPEVYKGTLKHYIVRDPKINKSKAYDRQVKNSKEAILNYEVIGGSKNFYLLLIELLTGRHHQIRAQLAKLNIHIRGDLKYGAERSKEDGGIDLHSFKVEFMHPVKNEPIKVFANPPIDPLWDFYYNIIEKFKV